MFSKINRANVFLKKNSGLLQQQASKNVAAAFVSAQRVARSVPAVRRAAFQEQARFYSAAPESMKCFQCEQTKDGTGCTTLGVCGKTPEVSGLQDLLINNLKNLCVYTHLAGQNKVPQNMLYPFTDFIMHSMYATLTNVNFDPARFIDYLKECERLTAEAKKLYESSTAKPLEIKFPRQFNISAQLAAKDTGALATLGLSVGVDSKMQEFGSFNGSIQELLTYGLKGLCAYASEALQVGNRDDAVYAYIHEAFAFLSGVQGVTGKNINDGDDVLGMAIKCGEVNITVMSMLDGGARKNFGVPSPTPVSITPVPGKCILVSGHDIGDLVAILKQTEGKGINVYTHGELLPAHAYPEVKKFKHLKGNYGGAWQVQQFEFSQFPGPIVMTTNCIIEPRKKYIDRIFTTSEVGWPGVKHVKNRDFSAVVESALANKGFADNVASEPQQTVTTGFSRETILSVAPHVINAVQKGDVKRILLAGGCDGTEGERNFFRDIVTSMPKESLILTLGCAKYRFNKLDHGNVTISDPKTGQSVTIPRLLDMGQCNDAIGAVQVALALKDALGLKSVNDLPLSYAISWFEQKAVVIFLTMIHLGIKNIRIGPKVPAFLPMPVVLQLVEKLNLVAVPTADVKQEVDKMMKGL